MRELLLDWPISDWENLLVAENHGSDWLLRKKIDY
jgi:hypothetical protein